MSLGSRLKTERVRRNASLEDIAAQTRIGVHLLQAIEEDHLESMPSGFFSRSFIRQYAEALALENAEIERLLEEVPKPAATLPIVNESKARRMSLGEVFEAAAGHEPDYLNEARFVRDSRPSAYWMGLAGVLICGSIAFLSWQKRPDLFDNVMASATPGSPGAEQVPSALPPPPSVEPPKPAVLPASEVTATGGEDQARNAEAGGVNEKPVTVTVRAKEETWLRLVADGERVYRGLMGAGETKTFTSSETAMLYTGNAGGLELSYNGTSIGSPGPRGGVRTVLFTPANYEIQSRPLNGLRSGASNAVREP